MGLTEEVVRQELEQMVEPLARQALASGYLQARIRARLEPFYTAYAAGKPSKGAGL